MFSGSVKQSGGRLCQGLALGKPRFLSGAEISISTIRGTTNHCRVFWLHHEPMLAILAELGLHYFLKTIFLKKTNNLECAWYDTLYTTRYL